MTIISTAMLDSRLPGTANSTSLTNAVNRASGFVNTWAVKYDPFDDFQESPEAILAPPEIGEICLQCGEAFYFLDIGQTRRDGNDELYWDEFLERKRTELMSISVSPTWETQTISLNSDKAMVIGSRTVTGGMWPRAIPFNAQVISGSSNTWINFDDFTVNQGGFHDNEYPDAWYFYAETSSVEGTLRYMRTYRNDHMDYLSYSRG
jgi:hypothetical protein